MAIHIGVDVVADPRHRGRPPLRSCRDTISRMSRLCAAAGIERQQSLHGSDATRGSTLGMVTRAAMGLAPDGLLVLTYSGHSDRGERDTEWCLYDGTLGFQELAGCLSSVPSTACVVVVAATCYAAALARFAGWPCTLVLIAACDDYQTVLDAPASEFIVRLEQAVLPGGHRDPNCVSYAWLRDELQKDTPDAERPQVWTNDPAMWTRLPFSNTWPELVETSAA